VDIANLNARIIIIVTQLIERAFLLAKQKVYLCIIIHVLSSVLLDFMLIRMEYVFLLVHQLLMERILLHNVKVYA
jgi:hypothetical protein